MTDPGRFFRETLPGQFNAALEAQAALGEPGRQVYEGMRGVDATLCVEVVGEGGGTFFLNVAQGRMQAGEAAAQPPFLTMRQDRQSFERLVDEAGDSAMALLGGLAGLTGGMHLTRQRVEDLAGLDVEGSAWRASAQEIIALAEYRAGNLDEADRLIRGLIADTQTPAGLRQRAQLFAAILKPQVDAKAAQ